MSKEVDVTIVGISSNGIKVEFAVGKASQLEFDKGAHTVHIHPHPDRDSERILVDITNEALKEVLKTRKLKKLWIDFELEEEE